MRYLCNPPSNTARASILHNKTLEVTDPPHFTELHFIVLRRCRIFCKLKVCGHPVLSKTIMALSSSICSLHVPVSHSDYSCDIFIFCLHYILYDELRSVIFDVTIVTVLGLHEPYSYNLRNLIDKCVCSDCSSNQPFLSLLLSLSLSPSLPISLDTTLGKPINNHSMTSKSLNEESHVPHFK